MFPIRKDPPLRRGVYVERFKVNEYRWLVAVDSQAELVGLKTAKPDEIPAKSAELWQLLDRHDPIRSSATASSRRRAVQLRLLLTLILRVVGLE